MSFSAKVTSFSNWSLISTGLSVRQEYVSSDQDDNQQSVENGLYYDAINRRHAVTHLNVGGITHIGGYSNCTEYSAPCESVEA